MKKTGFQKIERMWAQDGAVFFESKNGTRQILSVKEAATRAASINRMPVPEPQRKEHHRLVETIIQTCRQALAQSEAPKGTREKLIGNLLNGKNEDGSPRLPSSFEHAFQMMCFRFPYVPQNTVQKIMELSNIPQDEKEKTLVLMNNQYLMETAKNTTTSKDLLVGAS